MLNVATTNFHVNHKSADGRHSHSLTHTLEGGVHYFVRVRSLGRTTSVTEVNFSDKREAEDFARRWDMQARRITGTGILAAPTQYQGRAA